ncbi:hypothetical protein [Flagellimonas sp. 2504JD1-5]
MQKTKFSHKVMAVFLTLAFLPSLVPVNMLYASNSGPTAPEASSFEPVDATDMVNLATGDLSYVLPLMNVPSPEGGYPLALSYHAGISVDQEASWVGLGWNINPGAINRSVNGYPDDWKKGNFKEYFYDVGNQSTYTFASIGYSSFGPGPSVGLSLSHSDDRGFGGSVSFGVGFENGASIGGSIGSNGVSANGGVGFGSVGIGGSIGSNGVGLNAGYSFNTAINENGNITGNKLNVGVDSSWSGDISVNASYSSGEKGKKNSIGISLSSRGVSVTGKIAGYGTGANFSFDHAVSQTDYKLRTSGWFIPIFIPLGEGTLNASFGRQKVKYDLNVTENNVVAGTLYYNSIDQVIGYWKCQYYIGGDPYHPSSYNYHDPVDKNHDHGGQYDRTYFVEEANSLSDIYEVDVNPYSQSLDLDKNNAVFPNYDNYRVTAQGLSGSITPRIYENAALFGLSKEIEGDTSNENYELNYQVENSSTLTFDLSPEFHFENEYSSNLIISPASFDPTVSPTEIYGFLNGVSTFQSERKKGGRYVESYTNAELATSTPYNQGLLKANTTINYGNTTDFDQDGIGAFMVTTPDGKTYHYALPVYNHEIVSRQFGMGINSTLEDDAFYEKRQLKKYATHWLLTAVTGPDYIDINGNGVADDGDYGYWVNMDYGKWSDGYIWYAPHGKDYNVDSANSNLKSYTWGRKEIYYLDKIKTRTHTALFVKEERNDAQGKRQFYNHRNNPLQNTILDFRAQTLLRLKEIILLKNEDANGITKTNVSSLSTIPSANFSQNVTFYDPSDEGGGTKTISYSQQNNVLDKNDVTNWSTTRQNALKIIDFEGYTYELADGAPYTTGGVPGRLTLKHVNFKGKGGQQVLPSYKFEYNQAGYNADHADEWGYNKFVPDSWSLREITMPTGGKIKIDYEPDRFVSAIDQDLTIDANAEPDSQNVIYIDHPNSESFLSLGINVNSQLYTTFQKLISCNTQYTYPGGEPSTDPLAYYDHKMYSGLATVEQVLNSGSRLKLKLNAAPTLYEDVFAYGQNCTEVTSTYPTANKVDVTIGELSTGSRVAAITTTDGTVEYKTEYDYSIPGTSQTSGIVSYIPFVSQVVNEVPYGIELPPPVPMYGHVKVTSRGDDNTSLGHTSYEFKTLSSVLNSGTGISFPGILEMQKTVDEYFLDSNNNKYIDIESFVIEDYMSNLGQLLSMTSYNNQGQLLSKTSNTYLSPTEIDQGIAQESFQTYKEVDYESSGKTDKWIVNSSTKKIYPSALKSTTVTQGGITSTTYFDGYDAISGQLLETRTYSSDGTAFKTEVIPAYTKYSALGSRADNIFNRNMLTQEAMSKTYIDQSGSWSEIGADITTWQPKTYSFNIGGITNTKDVWRKHKSYIWDGSTDTNGIFTSFSGDDDGFDWTVSASSQPADWKLVSEISKYDEYSMPLEVVDINQNKASTKMGDDDSKVIATSNAAYNEMHYSGAEYMSGPNFDGNIYGVGQTTERAHTGSHSIKITTQQGFRTTMPSGYRSGKYKISVWASKDNYTNARVNDGSGVKTFNGEKVTAGSWVLLNHYVDWTSGSKTVYVTSSSGTTYFDDFRIHPVQSTMTSYAYNEWGELEAILSANNLATTFEYDEIGRLIRTHSEVADDTGLTGGLKKVAENEYEFAQEVTSPIDPLTTSVTYGSSGTTYQQYIATPSGGSGNYTYRWYKGIGNSSSNFESTWSGSSSTFTWTGISGCDIHWVKVVVTDNVYGYLGESTRIIRNNNECDPGSGGGNHQ